MTPDIFQRAIVYYRPPAVFVRDAHRADDIARLDRAVKLSIVQPGVGGGAKRILLRRPPVFLVHGLFSTTKTWNELQPLVPEGGLPVAYAPTKGFDGRFDVFAVGNPNVRDGCRGGNGVKEQIKLSLAMSLPGYAIGRVDVIGHSMGSLVIRQIIDDFIASEAPWRGVTKMPFRKLIAMDSHSPERLSEQDRRNSRPASGQSGLYRQGSARRHDQGQRRRHTADDSGTQDQGEA